MTVDKGAVRKYILSGIPSATHFSFGATCCAFTVGDIGLTVTCHYINLPAHLVVRSEDERFAKNCVR